MAVNPAYLAEASKCVDCLSESQKENATVFLLDNIALNLASGGGIHDLLSPSHPDTVPSFVLRGSLVVGNSTPLWEQLPIGGGDMVLRSNGADPGWAKLALNTDVVGTLAVVNGGTNSSAVLNNNRIMVSSGGAIVEAAALTNGQLLIGSTGAAPVAASLIAGANITITTGAGSITIAAATPIGTHSILDAAVHTDSVTQTVVRGSLIYGNSTPKWDRLAIGAAGTVLTSDGTDVSWASPVSAGTVTSFSAGNLSPLFTTNVATASTTPALTFSLNTQAANLVFAGPASGAAAGPTFRSLAAPDLPSTAVVPGTYGSATQVGQFTVDQQGRITAATDVAIAFPVIDLTADVTGILPVANGGTGTGTAFTQGSVIFVGAAGVYSEDNANFFWDNTNNRLGIGTIVPAGYLELSSNLFPSNNAFVITLSNDTGTNFPNIFYRRSRGTVALPTAVLVNDRLGGFGFRGYGATGYFTADNAVFRAFAAENFTNTAMGTYVTLETTPLGSTTRFERLRIDPSSLSMSPAGTAAGSTNELRFLELATNGVNYTGFKAPDAITASEIYVLPNAAPAANRFLQSAAVAGGVSALNWAQVSLTADVTGILPVANGGSGTSTAFTAGSVVFAGPAGVFTQDNANLFYDDSANRLITNQLRVEIATSATVGGIYFGATRTIHNFGTGNIFVGSSSGNLTLSGIQNSSVGASSLASNTSGANNAGMGYVALLSNTTGSFNTALGSTASQVNQTGSNNTAVGYAALLFNTTNNNTAVGSNALRLTSTGNQNSGIGTNALTANTFGTNGVAIGYSSLSANTIGISNTAVGSFALSGNIDGDSNFAMGFQALLSNVSGDNNVAIGPNALSLSTGSNNLAVGMAAGNNLTTGSNNIIVGYDLDSPTATNSNTLTIGNLIFGTALDATGLALASGNIGIGVITPLAKFHVTNSAAATVATIIKAAAAQSANLTEWQTSAAVISTKIDFAGNVGVRMAATTLTAYLHIAAGTTAASTAPIKLTTGTSMTAAEAGAVEFTTDDLFFTITTGAARKRLLMADATAGLTSGKMPIATTNGRLIDLTASSAYTLTNGTIDRTVDIDVTSLDEIADLVYTMWSDLNAKGILG